MQADVTNVKFAGLGGMGVIKASDVFADVVFQLGYDVKKAEVHGMSQRGGSISSDVRFGRLVWSPMIPDGASDFLVVMDAGQVEVNRGQLRAEGVLIIPDALEASRLPHQKALNVALLGVLSVHFAFELRVWHDALKSAFPQKLHKANEHAFALGREAGTLQ